ncbi:hypothetical protein Ahy_B03g066818 [Arachis hypogaea]|uniref:Transposase Tnp1/En/Spm-like domain-containing protein n=2 Tax=Arachis hypogaea TaxID=3818 RepID=A0A445A511_ARAHY|nr:hypothetical protein Ahy_B03g066818 [Arachis hypogaea]
MTKRKTVSSRENTSTHEFNDSSPVDQNESSESIEPEPTLSTGSEVPNVQLDVQGRKSNKYWTVDLEDASGVIKEGHLRLKDVWVLSRETRIIVHWNEHGQPIGESGGLLGLFLGAVAGNFKNFPISYEKWPLVPIEPYKNGVYRDIIQRFFKVDDGQQKKYILQNLGRKWKDDRCKLFNDNYKWNLTREQNIAALPKGFGVSLEQWATFIDYRLRSKTQDMCEKNASNREKQTIPHTLGSKTIARKKHELETANKRVFTRAEMYPISHKKKDGSFVNDEAREKSEQLTLLQANESSTDDAYVKLFGKEHPGRVRGVGFGVCPSQVMKSSNSFGGVSSSCNHDFDMAKVRCMEVELQENKATISLLQAQVTYFINHCMGGKVPHDFPTATNNGVAYSPIETRPSSTIP